MRNGARATVTGASAFCESESLMRSRVELLVDGGAAVITWAGELDLAHKHLIVADVARVLTRSQHILIDLSAVTFIDTSVLSTLVWADGESRNLGGRLTLVAPNPIVAKVLSITQLDGLLNVQPSMDQALAPSS